MTPAVSGNLPRLLRVRWYGYLLLCLLPLLLLGYAFGGMKPLLALSMPLFVLGLASLFASLRLFGNYKRALMTLWREQGQEGEAAAWQLLRQRQQRGFIGAGLPAWIAALGVFLGLEPVAMVLLALGSIGVMVLYRLPKQLH